MVRCSKFCQENYRSDGQKAISKPTNLISIQFHAFTVFLRCLNYFTFKLKS